MKKMFLIGLFSIATLTLHIAAAPAGNYYPKKNKGNILNENQIENYVQHIVASLFNGHSSQEQKSICNHVTKKLLRKTDWEKNYNLPVERTTQEVYLATLSSIVDYVERKSFDLAKIETGDYDITIQVSNYIRDEVEKAITTTGTFYENALQDYVGRNLEYKVRTTCHQFYLPDQTVAKRYDEKNCRICFKHFSPSLPWVYLVPCGHDMCTECAETYFIVQNKKRCPVCNQEVDTYQLHQTMYRPSAPWLY